MIRLYTTVIVIAIAMTSLQACFPLVVGGAATGAVVAHDRRSTGTFIDDQGIEISILKKLGQLENINDTHISVTSYNHIVLLSGEVPDRETGLAAGQIARDNKLARHVHNELVIDEPSSISARSSDTLITARAKSSLLAIDLPGFDPTRVKVVTDRKVVYLMGLVTKEEADAASERVRRVSGVRKVVRLFEFTDE